MESEKLPAGEEDILVIKIKHKGSFKKTEKFLNAMKNSDQLIVLREYGRRGVEALAEATPKRTGKTAESWSYEISGSKGHYTIYWRNSNTNDGVNIAVLIQYGHGTGWGGYVVGIDYINPALEPVVNELAETIWKEVTSA